MNISALAIFIVSTTIHLYASLKQNKKLRNYTKPLILASLLWWYVLVCTAPSKTMIAALLFSWLGDVLLIGPGVKYFTIGGIAFMISHAFFIISYNQFVTFANICPAVIIVLAVIFFIAVCIIFSKLKAHLPKPLFYPMALYLYINGTMNCFAVFRAISNPCTASIITCIGAFLFFISDTSLFFVRFKKDSRLKTHFLVMLTYSIGEFLIVLGMIPNLF